MKPCILQGSYQNRLAWLTAARWLLSAEALSENISETSPALKTAYGVEVEHYRVRFYDSLRPTKFDGVFSDQSYFEDDVPKSGSQLEERSVRKVLEFMNWPDEHVDLIDSIPLYTREEVDEMSMSLRGFKSFLLESRRFNSVF